jgi:hypothetical protein
MPRQHEHELKEVMAVTESGSKPGGVGDGLCRFGLTLGVNTLQLKPDVLGVSLLGS